MAVTVTVAALALTACSRPPESGYVLTKSYDAPYDWVQLTCGAYDSKMNCVVQIPVVWHEPAHWKLCLIDDRDPGAVEAGTCRNREVAPSEYDRYARGQHYPDAR